MSSKDLVLLSIKEPTAKSFHSAVPALFSASLFGNICIATKTGGTIKRPVEPSMLFTPFPLNISQSLCECWQWNRSDVQRFANRDSHRKAASRGICGAMTWSTMSLSVFSDKTAFSSHWARQIFNQPAMHLLTEFHHLHRKFALAIEPDCIQRRWSHPSPKEKMASFSNLLFKLVW